MRQAKSTSDISSLDMDLTQTESALSEFLRNNQVAPEKNFGFIFCLVLLTAVY